MSDFRELSPTMLASPQIGPNDVAEAAEQGVTLVINNRPDGESPNEPQGPEIEAAARAAGLDYLAIPIGSAGFGEPQVEAMQQALENTDGKILAYCRSGTRSTLLWSLAQARAGRGKTGKLARLVLCVKSIEVMQFLDPPRRNRRMYREVQETTTTQKRDRVERLRGDMMK